MWKDTLVDSELNLCLYMYKPEAVQLLKNLAPFILPPSDCIQILELSKAVVEVKHFLAHSMGQPRQLYLNHHDSDLLDGSEWVEAIVKALPRVKEAVSFCNFSFSKEQVEAIVNNSFNLETLEIKWCKLRKYSCLVCDA
jgi:hypothetical protein